MCSRSSVPGFRVFVFQADLARSRSRGQQYKRLRSKQQEHSGIRGFVATRNGCPKSRPWNATSAKTASVPTSECALRQQDRNYSNGTCTTRDHPSRGQRKSRTQSRLRCYYRCRTIKETDCTFALVRKVGVPAPHMCVPVEH